MGFQPIQITPTVHTSLGGICEIPVKEYIKHPKAKIPATNMLFVGVENGNEIDDLWDYIKQFDADGKKK